MKGGCTVAFPNLGITIENLPSSFSVFGFDIAFYGVIIAIGMLAGLWIALWQARRTGQKEEPYFDLAFLGILLGIIGARLYYVAFRWEEYKDNLLQIFNTRGGGLAIYGGVIGGVIASLIVVKWRKLSAPLVMDTACLGLLTGQIIGRWGNFMNKEVFGGYSDGLFAMQLPWEEAVKHMPSEAAAELSSHVVDGTITVSPTFLYESVWNLGVLLLLIFYTKHKKADGELVLIYMFGYGAGRFWIEGIRTDQLFLWNTQIPVSQLFAAVICVISAVLFVIIHRKAVKKQKARGDGEKPEEV